MRRLVKKAILLGSFSFLSLGIGLAPSYAESFEVASSEKSGSSQASATSSVSETSGKPAAVNTKKHIKKSGLKPVSKAVSKSARQPKTVSASATIAKPGAPIDVSDGHWAQSAVQGLIDRGIIKLGPDSEFHGGKPASRYDVAVMVSRAIQNIDPEKLRNLNAEDMKLLHSLMADLANEIGMLRGTEEKLFKQEAAIEERFTAIEKKQDERLAKIEKEKSPVRFNGDYQYWYQTCRVEDNAGGKGQTSKNTNRFRLGGDIAIDDTTSGVFRLWVDQKVMRDGDLPQAASVIPTVPIGGTAFRCDFMYLEKKNALGGDWRLGRQVYKLGNGLLFQDYMDGLTFTRKFDNEFTFRGGLIAENSSPTPKKSHGLDANMLSFDYNFAASHTLTLSRLQNQSDFDKYSILKPRTGEDWYSIDAVGSFSHKLGYFATFASYKNDLDVNNTASSQQYLRTDIDNTGYILGCKYTADKKFDAGLTFADQGNSFRSFDVLNVYYPEFADHPLEQALNALAITAVNARTGAMEGVFPPSSASAAPFATPINPVAIDNRGIGFSLGDIHGYRDLQLAAHYCFRPDLQLRVMADFMAPSSGKYNYRDLKAFTAYLRYNINPRTRIELRSIHVTSEYGRSASDFRTEVFTRF
ncbi:MAG: S-layer homology domain-containing protein [Candidatus Riflebacteria bacterium]|nr:S-layer homology domain-containing protein [Candidatus Riflebacteria bacterium]